VGNDEDVRAIAFGANGILSALAKDAVWVDHTTASAALARELDAACSAQGSHFLDAPVSGGESGAQRGRLSAMVGGEPSALERVQEVLHCYAQHVVRVGPAGAGQLAKMVNQICIAGLLQGPKPVSRSCASPQRRPNAETQMPQRMPGSPDCSRGRRPRARPSTLKSI
jgi:3-hydroxyisobutyrate dehydrogenase-like beta-hydroxyacid dehydrogenase